MSDHEAFLSAILESPDDDAPRLVYADWLDEHGDPDRATFIRVQIELARLPEFDPQRPRLRWAERQLRNAAGEAWLPPVPDLGRPTFRRGFVEAVEMGPWQFLTSAAGLF